MRFFAQSESTRRDRRKARRRAITFSPSIPEALDPRRLLAAGALGINVEIGPYSSFVNWLQVPGSWGDNPGQSTAITLNSSGDPTSDATLLFDDRVNQSFNGPDPNAVPPNLSGTYHISFTGQATIEPEYPGFSTPFTVQNQSYNTSTNTTTADLVVPDNNTAEFFGITFVNTQATPTSGLNTGFSNAKLIRPGYAANSTQLYSNEFLAALKPYSVLRYLDPENTNNQPFFNGNTLVTVNASQVDQTGMPWEYLVALANASNTDMWINVPQGATDDYVTALAGIIKNGGTVGGVAYPGLNSNLKVYVEYSNEVWGGIGPNEYYQEAAVQNSATNQPLSTFAGNQYVYQNTDGTTTTSVYTALGRRYLERTAEIGQLFQSVLGADPTHQKIRPVLGWQENNSSFYPAALSWYEHFFGTASSAFYGIGNANYWNPTDYTSVDSVIATLQAQETSYAIPNTIAYSTYATYYGLQNVSYEGGPSISGDPSTAAGQVALAASRDPRMEQLVYQHYVNYFEDGGQLANYFDGPFGLLSPQNEWPIAELSQYGNPSSSPRYQGTVDLANASPVAVTAGTAISSTSSTSFAATTDTLGTSFVNPSTGEQGYWLLNVASAGTYDLSLTSGQGGTKGAGQFEIFLNDRQVGGVFTQGLSASLDLGQLPLSAGMNTLSLVVVTSGTTFQPTSFVLTPPSHFAVGDAGFESVSLNPGTFAYDPTGSAWTFTGLSGVSSNNSGFTNANPAAPQGSQVGVLQVTGSFSQSIANWAAGNYTIAFDAAQRGSFGNGVSNQNFEVLVDGVVVSTFKPNSTSYQAMATASFTVGAGSHSITFKGLDTVGGDNTAFIDAVAVNVVSPSIPTIGDAGFESVPLSPGSFAYNPTGSAWTFSASSGVASNGSAFTAGNSAAPQGTQVGFLQYSGSITQAVTGWAAGTYTIAFDASQRGNYGTSNEDFEVMVDGNIVGTFKPVGTSYQAMATASFTVTAGTHTMRFVGLDSVGGDNTAFIDAVAVNVATGTAPPAVADSGFENIPLSPGSFAYNPTGSAWTFSASSGVASNGSAFTAGNSAAPQGTQVGFLQYSGSITQAVTGWAAGTYTIAFDASQRGNYGTSNEDFEVLVDGVIVGKYKPTSTSYQAYTTSTFTVGAGSHTIAFVGLDTVGGDNTAFLDNISIL